MGDNRESGGGPRGQSQAEKTGEVMGSEGSSKAAGSLGGVWMERVEMLCDSAGGSTGQMWLPWIQEAEWESGLFSVCS